MAGHYPPYFPATVLCVDDPRQTTETPSETALNRPPCKYADPRLLHFFQRKGRGMIEGFPIEPKAVYDDSALSVALGVSAESLARARRAGVLRYTRKGRRILYLGQWILDWLDHDTFSGKGVGNAR